MGRSVKKGPFVQPKLLERVQKLNEEGKKVVLKTWSRASTIFPDFVGHTFAVHDGRPHPDLPGPRRRQKDQVTRTERRRNT